MGINFIIFHSVTVALIQYIYLNNLELRAKPVVLNLCQIAARRLRNTPLNHQIRGRSVGSKAQFRKVRLY
jgi:hypothetical protein